MKIVICPPISRLFQYFFLAILLAGFSVNAKVIDDFSSANLNSGYSSSANGGILQTTNPVGQLNITPAAGAGKVTSIKKTQVNGVSADALFTNVLTHTLEFKVQVISIYTDGNTTDGQAVLGWVPNPDALHIGRLLTNGYSVSVGQNSATIRSNAVSLYTTNFVSPLPTAGLVLVMRMTPDPANTANVILKSTVYTNVSGPDTVLFEYSVTNTPDAFGIGTKGGQIALGALNDASGFATAVSFDNLQVFDTIREVLDDFSGPYPANWVDVNLAGTAANVSSGGQLQMTGQSGVIAESGAYKSDKVYSITDGTRFEQRLDVVTLGGDANNSLFLGYTPSPSGFSALDMYHIAVNPAGDYLGAAVSGWWETPLNTGAITYPGSNLRLIQIITGEGTSARIESRVENLSVDVNDPARLVHQFTFVDTAGVYLNANGFFAMGVYHDGSVPGVDGTFTVDNAEVNKTLANTPPNITLISPADGTNFYDPAGGVSFKGTDDISVPTNGLTLTLNGIAYTNGSPGVTVTPATGAAASRTFAFTGLQPNTYYNGTIVGVDNVGASNVLHYEFDTFLQTNLTVEIEDFNHDSGGFIDWVYPNTGVNAYNALGYTVDVDYHNTNPGQTGAPAPTDTYRVFAPQGFEIWQIGNNNPKRTKYVGASDPNEYEVYTGSGNNGDWANYTRTYPAGTYKVYLRESTGGTTKSLSTLAIVGGDPTTTTQFTTNVGTFTQLSDAAGDTGIAIDRTVPLLDGTGNPAIIRFSGGVETLRLTFNLEGGVGIVNYMAFITTPDPGVLRPVLGSASPAPGSKIRFGGTPEGPYASIVNRDTAVTNISAVKLNGVNVTPLTVTPDAGGMTVSWPFLSVPIAPTITNVVICQDSQGVSVTNSYTYSYPFLRASNRLAGALTTRGFNVRMVHSSVSAGGNSIATAEGQLALPTPTLGDAYQTWQTNAQIINWDDNAGPAGPNSPGAAAVTYVPGLDGNVIVPPVGSGFSNNVDHFAVESLAYLYLKAGPHRFSMFGDDYSQVASGTNTTDHGGVLTASTGAFGLPAQSFDFLVEADGLYPMRAIWQEGGGYADFHLYSRDPNTGLDTCVNDPAADPASVKAFYYPAVATPAVLSSAAVGGAYSIRFDASVNTGTSTATVPILSDAMQFYKLSWSSALTVTNATKVGTNIVIKYQ